MGDALDLAYATVLTRFTQHTGQEDVLLDEENGLAAQLRQALDERLQKATDENRDFDLPQSELEALRLERDTWSLIQILTSSRILKSDRGHTAQQVLEANPFTPLAPLLQRLVSHSDTLQELMAVREWAEETAPSPQAPETRKGFWNFTRHRIVHNKRVAGSRAANTGNIVKELDLDAVNRVPGAVLDPNDESYERALSQALYAFIRAGQLDNAMELCRNVDHPWRAAVLRGSVPFSWSLFDPHDGAPQHEDSMDVVSLSGASGNTRRRLWKEACAAAARTTTLNPQTRGMYAALAPQRSTLPVLLAQCKTWEDHLWAHINVLFEERLDAQISELKGCFWLSGLDAIQKPKLQLLPDAFESHVQHESAWKQEVFRELEGLQTVAVEEGAPAQSVYHMVQLSFILNRTNALLDEFTTSHLPSGAFERSGIAPSDRHRVVRFFVHVCLFSRYLSLEISPKACHEVIETYISYLEASSKTDLVALYASCLGSAAIDRYASFLAALPPQISNAERHAGLKRAEEHGFDSVQVALAVAEQAARRAFDNLPGLRIPLPAAIDLSAPRRPLSDPELLLLTSVEWLVFDEETLPRALTAVNDIIRYFLGMGNIYAAQVAMTKVPEDIANQSTVEASGVEHRHYQWLLEIWRMFDELVHFAAEEPYGESSVKEREARGAWMREFAARIDTLHERTLSLLENRWLMPLNDDEPVNKRREELNVVRQIYVPELVIRLHAALMESRRIVPRNVRLALELANVVADARHHIAEEFYAGERNRLPDYLSAVRVAAIEGMALGNCADPFKIVASS
ncbi:hypothetical protein EXIGLDRAFT_676668 [Exidia glandulosa HHB12029]|uniref:Nuclear pore complex protein n=1 Tax=Exidia glandulosa HHB12029 TaxID=1314781 RepID=A0A165GR06_EXIGL|nr:hypothetical protein EXIGLDRAFT_676668 [Exidia glandulosa HHB12029]